MKWVTGPSVPRDRRILHRKSQLTALGPVSALNFRWIYRAIEKKKKKTFTERKSMWKKCTESLFETGKTLTEPSGNVISWLFPLEWNVWVKKLYFIFSSRNEAQRKEYCSYDKSVSAKDLCTSNEIQQNGTRAIKHLSTVLCLYASETSSRQSLLQKGTRGHLPSKGDFINEVIN